MTASSPADAAARPTSFWLRHPALSALLVTLVLLLAALAWPLLSAGGRGGSAAPAEGLPWQVELLPGGGSRVFGLAIGSDTLAEAQARWGDDLRIAIVAAHGELGALEASSDRHTAGFLTGRLILSTEVEPALLVHWRQRASKREFVQGGSALETLQADDLAEALRRPIVAIGFVPSANLDAETLRQRFGEPSERLVLNGLEHWLYPERGLAVLLDPARRELLQYVAPREFEARLRRPLLDGIAAAAAEAASAADPAGPAPVAAASSTP